ncbi:MAG: hypothetical protein ACLPPF_09850 [Rhodomicrobium sp.]
MDPDMVRQQEEAEREALMLLAQKRNVAAFNARPVQAPAGAGHPAEPASFETVLPAQNEPAAVFGEVRVPYEELRAGPAPAKAKKRKFWAPLLAGVGRFISTGVAGAMLGGGIGIVAANYLNFPAGLAKLVIFGGAGSVAAICAVASLFTGGTEPRQMYR